MSFNLLCMLATVSSGLFGLAFLFFPDATTAGYGVSGWNAGTMGVARLYGASLLYLAVVAFVVRGTVDSGLQRRWGMAMSAVSMVALVLSLQIVLSGAVNAAGWSTVLIYAFFTVSWFIVGRRAG